MSATYQLQQQGAYSEAEVAYREALAICQRKQGHDRRLADLLTNLGAPYANTKRYEEAPEYLRRSLAVYRRVLGDGHPDTIRPLVSLSTLYGKSGRLADAEHCLHPALAAARTSLGPEHPITGAILSNYAVVLRRLNRKAEAREAEKQMRAIRETMARENPAYHTVDLGELLPARGRR